MKKYRLTEGEIKNIVLNTAKRFIKENDDSYNNMEHYTHFAINKDTGKIMFEWDYSDIDGDELRQFKKDYFGQDLMDNYELPLKNFVIYTKQTLKRKGIDINDNRNYGS